MTASCSPPGRAALALSRLRPVEGDVGATARSSRFRPAGDLIDPCNSADGLQVTEAVTKIGGVRRADEVRRPQDP